MKAGAGQAGSGTDSAGSIHPELLARLQKLGIGLGGEKAVSGELPLESSPKETHSIPLKQVSADALDAAPSVDKLLTQLDDLDARSRVLQRDCDRERVLRRAEEVETRHRVSKAADDGSTTTVSPVQGEDAEATRDFSSEGGVAKAIAREHPLSGLSLTSCASSCEFQRHGCRAARPPLAPNTAAAGRHPGNLSRMPDSRSRQAHPASPSSARERPRSGSGSRVALPPLKPSASAPGCLMGIPWVDPRRR